jgi:hypothetical protein
VASSGELLQHKQRMGEVRQWLRGRDGGSGWISLSNGGDDNAQSKSQRTGGSRRTNSKDGVLGRAEFSCG